MKGNPMGFEVYKGNLPKGARAGRAITPETQEVIDALTESAKTGMPVQFTWTVADSTETDNEKRRIRGIAFKNKFGCSLWVKEGKIIVKATDKTADPIVVNQDELNGSVQVAAEEAKHTVEVLEKVAEATKSAPKKTAAKRTSSQKAA